MAEAKEFLMTQEEYDKLVDTLEYLKNEKTREIAEKINVARGYGDLSENAEYDAAKAEQAENADLIRELEEKVKYHKIVGVTDGSVVNIGMTVKVSEDGKISEYTITGSTGADPLHGKISNESPVAKALIGRSAGDTVEVETPDESYRYTLKIEEVYKK